MMSNDKNKIPVMGPYHDMESPFSVSEMGNFAEYIARDPDKFPELILGSFALIRDEIRIDDRKDTIWIVARVIELKAISPFTPQKETQLYAEDDLQDPAGPLNDVTGPHTHQPMTARVRLERQMFNEGEKARQFVPLPIQRPPSARSKMHFPDLLSEEKDAPPSLREMLSIPKKGLTLGYVGQGNEPFQSNEQFLPYKWDVEDLDNKHIFIIGESGSGKTVLLKNLAYELRKHQYAKREDKPRILMTDVQGDIAQLLTHNLQATHLQPKGWQRKIKGRQNISEAMKAFGPFRLVIPAKYNPDTNFDSGRLVSLRLLTKKLGIDTQDIGLRMQDLERPSDVEYLYRVKSEQVAMLLDEIAEELKSVGTKASLQNLKTSVDRIMKKHYAPNVDNQTAGKNAKKTDASKSMPKTDYQIFVGDTPFYPSTFNAAKRALTSLAEYFDYHQPSIKGAKNPLDVLDFPGTVILYMDDLSYEERVMWEMQLVKWLYANRRKGKKTFVFFDEAHQIIPARPPSMGTRSAETFDRLRRNFELLAREGRKFGINLVLSTQSPRDLHPIVPEQCPTKIVMKISPQNAVAASLDKELAGIATKFGTGQFFITSPFNGSPDWVRVHSDAPPLPHMPMTAYWNIAMEAARQLLNKPKKRS